MKDDLNTECYELYIYIIPKNLNTFNNNNSIFVIFLCVFVSLFLRFLPLSFPVPNYCLSVFIQQEYIMF